YGWPVGFLAAAVGMGLGVVYFALTRKRLGEAGLAPQSSRRDWTLFAVVLAVLLLLLGLTWTGVIATSPQALQGGAIYVILGLAIAYFAYMFFFAGLSGAERRRVLVLLVLFIASSVFWSGFEQAGSSLNLFADRYTDRIVGHFEIPSGWFQSLNATFIIVFAPVFSLLWLWLDRRGRDLSFPAKFVLGLLGMAVGFLVMAAAARIVAGGSFAAPYWLVFTYLFHTWGELALSPVGMSATTQLTPKRFIGQSMGVWFASLALGNLLAGRIAGEFDASNLAAMPGQYLRIFWYGAIAALLLLLLIPLLRRLTR
ncbi:MAG: oligopeptide:H+ symporter, partial [Pseudomonadota bacterium]